MGLKTILKSLRIKDKLWSNTQRELWCDNRLGQNIAWGELYSCLLDPTRRDMLGLFVRDQVEDDFQQEK